MKFENSIHGAYRSKSTGLARKPNVESSSESNVCPQCFETERASPHRIIFQASTIK